MVRVEVAISHPRAGKTVLGSPISVSGVDMQLGETARRYHEDGFALVRGFFSPGELETIESGLDVLVRQVAKLLAERSEAVPRLHQKHERTA